MTEQNWLSPTREPFDSETPVLHCHKGLSPCEIRDVRDHITNVLEGTINDIEENEINNGKEMK